MVFAVALVTSATSLQSFLRHFAMHRTITGNVQGSLSPSQQNSSSASLTGSKSACAKLGIMYGASL